MFLNIYKRKLKLKKLTVHHKWIAFFCLWILFLSGVFNPFLGSPGVIQALQLHDYLNQKQQQLKSDQLEVSQLKHQSHDLLTNSFAQEKEIRKILGYAAADEIIFDLNNID